MIDPATGSNLVTVRLPNGEERHLKKCSPSDWMRLTNIFRATRKARKRVSMAGAPAAEVTAEMEKLDKTPVEYEDVERFFDEFDGQYEAILLSISKDHLGAPPEDVIADFDSLGLHPLRWCGIACALFNIPTVPRGKGQTEKKENGGAGEAPTGEPSPSSSPPIVPAPTSGTL